jgi:hypothetical protein
MKMKGSGVPNVIKETSNGESIVKERVGFLIGRKVVVRVWWSQEGQQSSPSGDLFDAILVDCIPIGRDYYFVFEANGKRSIIKTAAVLQISECHSNQVKGP